MDLDAQIAALAPGERLFVTMSMADYHARPEISSGFVRAIETVGEWTVYHQYIARDMQDKDANATRLGRIFHAAAPDPDLIRSRVYRVPSVLVDDAILAEIKPKWLGKTKGSLTPGTPISTRYPAHKAYLDAHKAKASQAGKEWMTDGEEELQFEQIQSVLDNPETSWLFGCDDAKYEQVCFYRDLDTGLVLKAMADFWHAEKSLIVDFKTTRHHTKRAFVYYATGPDLRVHVQCAHYCRVFGAENAAVVSVRNFRPTEAMYYEVPRWRLQEGQGAVSMALERIKECLDIGTWHSAGWGQRNPLDREGEAV